jgi:hypothetical protein
MKLMHLPNRVIINLQYLTHAWRNENDTVTLYFASSGGPQASKVVVKAGAEDLWMYLTGECGKDEDFSIPPPA